VIRHHQSIEPALGKENAGPLDVRTRQKRNLDMTHITRCGPSRNPIPTLTAPLSLKGFLPRCQTAARGPPWSCGAPGSKTDNARSTLGETAKILKPASFQELPLKDRIDEDRSSPLLS
jgi:hypothetical protein